MCEEDYCIDVSGGPYYETGECIKKGEVIGKDENGDEVVSRLNGKIDEVNFDSKTHSFIVKVKDEDSN